MRRFRVSSFLADVTQHIHSLRASGVMPAHISVTIASDSIALRKSAGILCTVPEAIGCRAMIAIVYRVRHPGVPLAGRDRPGSGLRCNGALEPRKIPMPEQWANFFIMVGGGAAALAGLIFVAMSINHKIIIRNVTHKNRAINMLTGFTAVFMACCFALIGNQRLGTLGFEWLVLWVIATAIFIRGYVIALRSRTSSIGLTAPRLAGGTACYLAEVAAATFLALGKVAGLEIAAIGIIVLFGFLISGAWLLMIGIYEDDAK